MSFGPHLQDKDSQTARRLACLLGGAIGDALGYRVELSRWRVIKRAYGEHGTWLVSAAESLAVSYDTQMTIFTLEDAQFADELRALVAENPEDLAQPGIGISESHDQAS